MKQEHFLKMFLKKNSKGRLRDIHFRARPERYKNEFKNIDCSHCGRTVAQVRVDSHIASGICFVCKRLGDEVVRVALAEQGIVTRTERRRFLRGALGRA